MIYLHTYDALTHDFYNPVDKKFYTISLNHQLVVGGKTTYYRIDEFGLLDEMVEKFNYCLPPNLYMLSYINGKKRLDDLNNSKLRIALNSI